MRHFTIHRLMVAIAIVAVVLGGLIGLARMIDWTSIDARYSPRAHCQSNLRNIALALLGYLGAQEGE